MIKINPSKYTGVTVLPSEIPEKHLILSTGTQIKVIVFAFSKANTVFSVEEIVSSCGISFEQASEAVTYWKDLGFLLESDEQAVFLPTEQKKPETVQSQDSVVHSDSKKTEKVPHNNPTRLTYSEICARIAESEEIRILISEAEMKLGRPVGTGDQSSLILLHDYYGLPMEVVLCICEYARTKGKSTNMNYIYRIGVDWSNREIDTLERADEELKAIEKTCSHWKEFAAACALKGDYPTQSQEKYLSMWINEWKFTIPVLVLAFEEMRNHTEKTSFSYMHKVLSSWHQKGISTAEAVALEQEKFKLEQEQKAALKVNTDRRTKTEITPDPTASYDIRRAEERARNSVPVLKKREKR